MEITTVKLQKSTKSALDAFRSENESYDVAVRKLVFAVKQKNLKNQLIEAYQRRKKEDLGILEEWEPASQEVYD